MKKESQLTMNNSRLHQIKIICARKKLNYTHRIIKREYDRLYEYQLSYFCLFNACKCITKTTHVKNPLEMISNKVSMFSQLRNSFLIKKMRVMHTYLDAIDATLKSVETINREEEFELIDNYLRYMLISVGIQIPKEIFDNSF